MKSNCDVTSCGMQWAKFEKNMLKNQKKLKKKKTKKKKPGIYFTRDTGFLEIFTPASQLIKYRTNPVSLVK